MNATILLWFVGGAFSGLGGWFLLQRAAAKARIAALIRDTRTSKVKDLRRGLVEVEGRIRAVDQGQVLLAPLSGRACVYYSFVVEEGVQRTSGTGKNRRTRTVWVNRVRDVGRRAFVLDDGTGTVRVDLERAEVGLAVDAGGGSGFLNNPTPAFEQALQRYRVASSGLVFNKSLRYRETVLCPDDPLYALGTFTGQAIEKGHDGVLIVTDRGEAAVQQLYDGEASGAKFMAYALFAAAAALPIMGFVAMR